ncbi:ABC transporter ATP-binding protein [Cypionkella sp.]|uniref:energy-coupling factor ABC transporter ATP-binding protein n=1 Tax=Cypionkella sp. TaxID=2811411 RepID=UPI002AB9DDB0|nr:ABC transporter ATP-binding protein [Cypionkella sp.]MDZ4394743.1 ABC transporter ATP-binding protein [Cypionkella sp.]
MTTTQGITLQNASVTLTGKPILSNLSLTLNERRIGIIGRNGSGKTTLLRLIAGLIPPTTGSVTIDGLNPTDRKAILPRLGILFQNPDHQILFPTVAEELGFGLRQQGQTQAAADQAVATLLAAESRSHWAQAATHTLSQGQRHYLCLLSILLMQPQTILLDEPFAGLDLPTQIRLARRLNALPQRLITITHDPAAVSQCDRVLWLDQGQIRADGPPGPTLVAFTTEMTRIGELDADTHLPSQPPS